MSLRVPKEELPRLRTRDLGVLCGQMDWSESSKGFVTPQASFETVLQSLLNHGHWFDASSLLAHALPPREAIWWSVCVCEGNLELTDSTKDSLAAQDLLSRARDWVMSPDEALRIALHDLALSMPNSQPAHWVGMSIFWATGNITPDAGVVTPPPPYLYARGVSAAVDLAASLAGMNRESAYQNAFLAGIDIASGGAGGSVGAGK